MMRTSREETARLVRRRRGSRRASGVAAIAALGLILSGCGGAEEADDPVATNDDDSGMVMEDDGEEHTEFAFGEPADEADADRTIEVDMLDELAYDPPTMTIEEGETITFVVTNVGQAVHEFVIGDEDEQDEHEAEMQEMAESGMDMHADANALTLEAGETANITWHFTSSADLLFGCHEPGHYVNGMVGTFDMS